MHRSITWLPVFVLLLLAACGGAGDSAPGGDDSADTSNNTPEGAETPEAVGVPADALARLGDLTVTHAEARVTGNVGAVYLTVENDGPADRLVGYATPVTVTVEAHESVDDAGVMRMRPRPEGFAIPAGGRLALEPGGSHLMLIEPHMAADATEISMVLTFEEAGDMHLAVPLDVIGRPTGPHEDMPDHEHGSLHDPPAPEPPEGGTG